MAGDPICTKYPILYELATHKELSVHDAAAAEWVIQFNIRLPPIIRDQWYSLATQLNGAYLNDNKDSVFWKWTSSRKFTVKSVYMHLTMGDNGDI
jgi:hypothetical protein